MATAAKKRKPAVQRDIYQDVTDSIIKALETAGEWTRPWTNLGLDAAAPRSVDGHVYKGLNVVLLWISAMENGYEHGVWGTYNAWGKHNAQVRGGEKGTLVTLWKRIDRKADAKEIAEGKADKNGKVKTLLLRSFTVFNVAQVDGYELPTVERPQGPEVIEHAETFFQNVGATVEHHGDSAYYSSALDRIVLPHLDQFVSAERYYATVAHEHAHWTGHESRLDRQLANRFGSEAYAGEELVAELSAAFTGAHLGIESIVREDHAGYVKNWLKALRNDKKAIFTAASQAQKATDFLLAKQGVEASASTDDNEEELLNA